MASYTHTDGKGNLTTRNYGTIYSGPQTQAVDPYDPFSKYANAFEPVQMQYMPAAAPVVELAPAATAAPVVQVADPGLDRYQNFLRSQFIDPNSIGTGYVNRSSGELQVPSAKQESAAVAMLNQGNAMEGDYLRAANEFWQRGRPDLAIQMRTSARDLKNTRGSSYEDKLKYYMGQLYGAPSMNNSSNGFAG